MERNYKRISVMIREDQYESMYDTGINISGMIRDLIDDRFSEHLITVAVEEETRELYDKVISNTASSDTELEPYLRRALMEMLKDKIGEMQALHTKLKDD